MLVDRSLIDRASLAAGAAKLEIHVRTCNREEALGLLVLSLVSFDRFICNGHVEFGRFLMHLLVIFCRFGGSSLLIFVAPRTVHYSCFLKRALKLECHISILNFDRKLLFLSN